MSTISLKLDLLRRAFGLYGGGKDGINYAFRCPNCGKNNKKKLIIRVDNDAYHCWVCGIKGKNLRYLIKKHCPALLSEYIKLSGKNLNLVPFASDEVDLELILPRGFLFLGNLRDHPDPDVSAVLKYARQRGLSSRDLWYFRLGTCTIGRYRRRLIIPSFDSEGLLNYYVARSIDENPRKYLNPKVAKKNIIFNDININWQQELTLVEGPFDLMKCDENATCLLGSTFGPGYELFKKIIRNQTPIIMALDQDAEAKTHGCAKLLSEFGVKVRIMDVSDYEDVGSMSSTIFSKRKSLAVEWNATDRLHYLIRKIKSGSII